MSYTVIFFDLNSQIDIWQVKLVEELQFPSQMVGLNIRKYPQFLRSHVNVD